MLFDQALSVEFAFSGEVTSLSPRDGGYLLPVKAGVRRVAGVELGDVVDVHVAMTVRGYNAPVR